MVLEPNLDAVIRGACNQLGGASTSTVMSHWILDWVGISPLLASYTLPPEVPAATNSKGRPKRRRTGSQPTKVQLLTLGEPVFGILQAEAQQMGIRYSQLLRSLFRAKMGLTRLQRREDAPNRQPLSASSRPERVKRSVHLPLDQIELLQRLSTELGGGEKSTIAAHLILDFVDISPLR